MFLLYDSWLISDTNILTSFLSVLSPPLHSLTLLSSSFNLLSVFVASYQTFLIHFFISCFSSPYFSSLHFIPLKYQKSYSPNSYILYFCPPLFFPLLILLSVTLATNFFFFRSSQVPSRIYLLTTIFPPPLTPYLYPVFPLSFLLPLQNNIH